MERKKPQTTVILVGEDYNGETLLAIDLGTVVSAVTTYTTLRDADTLQDVHADANAFELVSQRWNFEALEDEDGFDAQEYFGEDYSWLPEARFDSRAWLDYVLPKLQAELEQPDTGWGFDYEPAPFINVEHRETVENALRELGRTVVDFPRLAEFYYDPPKNWRDHLPSGIEYNENGADEEDSTDGNRSDEVSLIDLTPTPPKHPLPRTVKKLQALWPSVLASADQRNPYAKFLTGNMVPVKLSKRTTVTVSMSNAVAQHFAHCAGAHALAAALAEKFGGTWTVEVVEAPALGRVDT